MRKIEYTIDEQHDGVQVGKFLKGQGFSRAVITELKYNDGLFLNGSHIRTVDPLRAGDVLTVRMCDYSVTVPNPGLSAPVMYDDADIVIFDKPYDMPSHQSIGHYRDTLANLFAAMYPDLTFRSVSRLDKNTSGLVMIAKNKLTASKLMSCPEYRPEKMYYAVTAGGFAGKYGDKGEIIAPIAREEDNYIKRTVREDGVYAHTNYRVTESSDRFTLLEISLVTGRTHQIRVHFSHLGFPLYGDKMYGGDTRLIGRQALHCGYIRFRHPMSDEMVVVRSELPEDIKALLDELRKDDNM